MLLLRIHIINPGAFLGHFLGNRIFLLEKNSHFLRKFRTFFIEKFLINKFLLLEISLLENFCSGKLFIRKFVYRKSFLLRICLLRNFLN